MPAALMAGGLLTLLHEVVRGFWPLYRGARSFCSRAPAQRGVRNGVGRSCSQVPWGGVPYATKYGSTQEVAEAIATRLRERGVKTDVRAVWDVVSLDGYDAVVFGGALYFFRLIRKGRRFLSRHRKALSEVPVAVFGMGPIEDTQEQYVDARKHLDKSLKKNESVSPVSVTVFGGALDPTRLRFPDANPATKNLSPSDLRDWEAIEAWADSLPEALGLVGG